MGRATILKLAAEAGCDPRSARKAMEHGADAVRGLVGERVAAAAAKLGIALGVGHARSE
jgi:hypothetical protein